MSQHYQPSELQELDSREGTGDVEYDGDGFVVQQVVGAGRDFNRMVNNHAGLEAHGLRALEERAEQKR